MELSDHGVVHLAQRVADELELRADGFVNDHVGEWLIAARSGSIPWRLVRPNIVPSQGTPVGHESTQQELAFNGPVAKHASMAGRFPTHGLGHLAGSQYASLDELAESDSAMSATNISSNAAVPSAVEAVSHIAVNTGDLARFRSFYEGLLGLPHVITLRMGGAPHLRYAVFAVGPHTALRAVEVPGYDPALDGIGAELGRRGRIGHFSLLVRDEAALRAVRDRLVAAGASNGDVTTPGPYLSVAFRDPDGLEGQVSCPWRGFDPSGFDDELIECSNPQWTANLLTR